MDVRVTGRVDTLPSKSLVLCTGSVHRLVVLRHNYCSHRRGEITHALQLLCASEEKCNRGRNRQMLLGFI